MARKRPGRKARRTPPPPDAAALAELERVRHGAPPTNALEHARGFVGTWPATALGWLVQAEALQALGREQDAIANLRRGLKHAPDPRLRNHLGHLLVRAGRTDEARRIHERTLQQDPADGDAAHGLALLLANRGEPGHAAGVCRDYLAHVPGAPRMLGLLGAMHQRLGNPQAAAAAYEALLAEQPREAAVIGELASIRRAQFLFEEALAHYDRGLVLQPRSVDLLVGRGKTLEAMGRPHEAMKAYSRARAQAPADPGPRADMANLEAIIGSPATAEELATAAATRIQDPTRRAIFRASRLAQAGRDREAAEAAWLGVAHSPGNAWLWHELACLDAIQEEASVARLLELAECEDRPDADRGLLHYAAARVLDRRGEDSDAVFRRYCEGARLKRRTLTYTTREAEQHCTDLRAAFRALPDPSPLAAHDTATARPIFVVGMPRSGTTLVERILASHPAALGTGERQNLPIAATESAALLARDHGDAPDAAAATAWFRHFDDEAFDRIAARYRRGVCAPAGDYPVVVDKYPLNFMNIGLIARSLPEARIVLLRRDPLDTCVSYFQHVFDSGHPHSYDLYELGHFHRQFEALVEHWRRVLPDGWMLELDYAGLVQDTPAQVARLLEHCGLDWHDACLRFHETGGLIRTVSHRQARQPVYAHAVGRAERFRHHLQPLQDGLAGR